MIQKENQRAYDILKGLTFGDFVGLKRLETSLSFDGDVYNVSMVLVNTLRGADALDGWKNARNFGCDCARRRRRAARAG